MLHHYVTTGSVNEPYEYSLSGILFCIFKPLLAGYMTYNPFKIHTPCGRLR